MTRRDATVRQRVLIESCLNAGVPFFWHGPGTLLIKNAGLTTVLMEVLAAGDVVLGLEGFELEGSDILPRLDLIVNLDSQVTGRDELLATISDWPSDVWVDVTLRPREWITPTVT